MTTVLSTDVAAELRTGLEAVCRAAGLPARNVALIKYTMNAVYHVDVHVVRLARGSQARERADKLVTLMSGLEAAEAPVISLAGGIAQPVTSGDWVATIWNYVDTLPRIPNPADLAEPLTRLHSLTGLSVLSSSLGLPPWDPVRKTLARLDATEALPEDQAIGTERWAQQELGRDLYDVTSWLRSWASQLRDQLADVDWILPSGPIHGDAHTGNLLLPANATGVLCDLDGFCHGPREWDLTPTAHGVTRFGRSRSQYQAFTAAYGLDITTWNGWPVLRGLRELQLVTSVLPTLAGRPAVAQELAHRLRSLLIDDASTTWSRHT
jgi:hypothetical protein